MTDVLPPSEHGSATPSLNFSLENMHVDPKVEEETVSLTPSAVVDVKPPSTPQLKDHSPTPPVVSNAKSAPQLIGHLPRAETEALKTFIQIEENQYQYGTLGRSREALESMTCDCVYHHGEDERWVACGHGSDCINRLTQVECLPGDCRCGGFCQNQRFQRREYADIHIVQTEKKGFGLRAGKDLHKDAFIYEYVGDVISQPSFIKRMRQYAEEGIRHFYFMMLQKDEFIDATKRGGIGRFANHSCKPNCYVAKWTVGHHVRMGIFANRKIAKDEELTFNYNVDRYGHDAQPCYCGEPKCVGFIGGKTQTDIAAMDDLYLDALGISDEVEKLGLKGNKKKRSKKLDEDFVPLMKPIVEKDVPKVVQAVRQTQSRKVLVKLLTRIKITEDQSALRQIMRLRGFSLMTNILEDHAKDMEITALALECMSTWPLLQRNKVDDSKVAVPVSACAMSDHEVIKQLAQKLLDHWDTLESAYRIPKRLKQEGEEPADVVTELFVNEEEMRPSKRSRYEDLISQPTIDIKPLGKTKHLPMLPGGSHMPGDTSEISDLPPPRPPARPSKADIAAIIAAAASTAAAAAAAAAEFSAAEQAKPAEASSERKRKEKKHLSAEEKEAVKEKRLLKLVGAVVVKCMSKYREQMDHDLFKKHAKELTHLIAEKEKKSNSYKENKLDTLSDEKVSKIKKFSKEYIAKMLRKLEKGGVPRRRPPPATSSATPNSSADAEMVDADDASARKAGALSVEDVMDMDPGGSSDREDDDEDSGSGGRAGDANGHGLAPVPFLPLATGLAAAGAGGWGDVDGSGWGTGGVGSWGS